MCSNDALLKLCDIMWYKLDILSIKLSFYHSNYLCKLPPWPRFQILQYLPASDAVVSSIMDLPQEFLSLDQESLHSNSLNHQEWGISSRIVYHPPLLSIRAIEKSKI